MRKRKIGPPNKRPRPKPRIKDEMVDLGEFGRFSRATLIENRVISPTAGLMFDIPTFLLKLFEQRRKRLEQVMNNYRNRKSFFWSIGDILDSATMINKYIVELNEVTRLRDKARKIVNL